MSATEPLHLPRASLLVLEHDILELVATGVHLEAALDLLCRRVERLAPGVLATILTVRDGRLYPLAGPSLPKAYAEAVHGAAIGPTVGSCGTAAWRGEPVEVRSIRSDPLWRDYLWLPLPDDIKACWSSPIKSRDGRVVGTFAFYYREERGPSDLDRMIVDVCVHLCAVAIENDATRAEMRRLAFEDSVTGLLNRAAFHERARNEIGRAHSDGAKVAFHIIDVDDFKSINDMFGHHVGDMLLAGVAERLRHVVGERGAVARIGGDEFAVLQPCATREAAGDLARRLLGVFAVPFAVDEHRVEIEASIGTAVAGDDGLADDDLAEVLKSADLALYRAKADGRARHRFFQPQLAEAARSRRAMAEDLRHAADNGELAVFYQPIVDLRTNAVVGCEALLRWRSPTRGDVQPSVFIPLAEDIGVIGRLGNWALAEAAVQAARWPSDVTVSVNISPLQLRNPAFAEDARRIVTAAGIAPSRVVLEITETAVLNDDETTLQVLLALKRTGFAIALDDFGTGYSSLKALRAVPLDKIKIDQSFVVELNEAEASTTIVRAVIAMARSLGLTTTAEGVESADRAHRLAIEGCDEAQGYHYSPPLGADAILAYVRAANARIRPIGFAAAG